MKALVTGGTGVVGRELVGRLRERGWQVRVLSRSPEPEAGVDAGARGSGTGSARAVPGARRVIGDLDTGTGLATAVDGVDVIAHCASAADYRRPERDLAQTRRLLEAVGEGARPHLIYISIVGVDRIRLGYYRAKLDTERLIERSSLPWTILRTTQFHDLVLMFLALLTKGPVALLPRGFRGQPVDAGEAADRLADLCAGPAAGRVPDLGGPRVEDLTTLTRTYLAAVGRRRPILRVPAPGRLAADYRAGHHLLGPDGVRGERSFADYLRARIRPDGSFDLPYDLKRR